jgi:hypothetical protein
MSTRKQDARRRGLKVEWSIEAEQALKKLQPNCVLCESNSDLCVNRVSSKLGLVPGNVVILCRSCGVTRRNRRPNLPIDIVEKVENAALRFRFVWQARHFVKV